MEKANQKIELVMYLPSLISLKKVKPGAKQTPTRMRNIINPSINVAKNLFALKSFFSIK